MTTIAFFDVAGTIVRGNPWSYMFEHPNINQIKLKFVYARLSVWWLLKKLSLIDDTRFRHQWLLGMATLVKGMTREQIVQMFKEIVQKSLYAGDFQDDIVDIVHEHKDKGDTVVLVSGLFDVFIQQYAKTVKADFGMGSKLGYDGDICNGTIEGETCAGSRKLNFIQRYVEAHQQGLSMQECYAYADSLSDVPLLSSVGHAFAVYPEAELAEVAQSKAWTILGTIKD